MNIQKTKRPETSKPYSLNSIIKKRVESFDSKITNNKNILNIKTKIDVNNLRKSHENNSN